jgi:hypothetical protein
MDGNRLTKEAMKKAQDAERLNKARTLGSNDQRRNKSDVKRFKKTAGY